MAKKQKRKRINSIGLLFFVIIAILAIVIILAVKNIIALHMEQNRLKEQQANLEAQKDELTAELDNVDDLDYIEEQARKLLKMIRPGEVLYVINGEGNNADDEDDGESVIPAPPIVNNNYSSGDSTDSTDTWTEDTSQDTWTGDGTNTLTEDTSQDTWTDDTSQNTWTDEGSTEWTGEGEG